jgi:cytochrome c biogenesis protein ResB
MSFSMLVLAALVLLMVAGAVPVEGMEQGALFRTPAFVLLLAMLCVSCIVCCIRRARGTPLRRAGFWLTHLGVVCVLAGGLGRLLWEEREQLIVPVTPYHTVRAARRADGSVRELPFGVTVERFRVDYYDPDYWLCRPKETTDDGVSRTDYVPERAVRLSRNGTYDVGPPVGPIEAKTLKTGDGDWVAQHVLPDGSILQRATATARRFEADLRVASGDGPALRTLLAVNAPVSHDGWRFYLMSYDRQAERYVVLTARRDPGRPFALAGIWALIVGVAAICFPKAGA